jgi:hypothetical protein
MMRMRPVLLITLGVLAVSLLATACRPVQEHGPRWSKAAPAATPAADSTKASTKAPVKKVAAQFPVAPPPFSADIFPCSECHGTTDVVNRTPHKVEFHENIVLRHDEKNRWCLDCHSAQNRDKLHLADGRLVSFTESYRLCGQCHGPTLRNWKAGEHGKRTGSWSGEKKYLLCANCHNPHSPGFKPMKPEPAPIRQEAIK